jgi:Flp pilus assembly CpaE family ATPase
VLRGENCHIVLVFNPDVLSLRESQRLIQGLQDLALPLRLLICNKVTAQNRPAAEQVERELRCSTAVPLQRVALAHALVGGEGTKLFEIPEDIASRF